MNYEWIGKLFRKNPIQKIEKTVNIKVKLPPANKKSREKAKNHERKRNAKPLAFSFSTCFGVTKITTPI